MATAKKTKRVGLPKKYAKLGFKKGWAAYKKTDAYKRRKGIKVASKPTKKKTISRKTEPKRTNNVKRSTGTVKRTIQKSKRVVKSGAKKMIKGINKKSVTNSLVNVLFGVLGAIGGNVAVNMIPLKMPKLKSAIPVLGGVVLSTQKNNAIKMAGLGMAISGGVAMSKTFLPNVKWLAGEEDMLVLTQTDILDAMNRGELSEEEANLLLDSPDLSGPVDFSGPVSFGDDIEDEYDANDAYLMAQNY